MWLLGVVRQHGGSSSRWCSLVPRTRLQVVLSLMRSYKTRGLDLEEVRRRKEEEGLQLTEEQVS